jgi:hypothetical protein
MTTTDDMTAWTRVKDPGGRVIGYMTDGASIEKDPWGNGRSWVVSVDGYGFRDERLTLAAAKVRAESLMTAIVEAAI